MFSLPGHGTRLPLLPLLLGIAIAAPVILLAVVLGVMGALAARLARPRAIAGSDGPAAVPPPSRVSAAPTRPGLT